MMLDRTGLALERYMDLLSAPPETGGRQPGQCRYPGYQTRDLAFASELDNLLGGSSPTVVEVAGLKSKNDGNNVSVDRESRLLAENAHPFQYGLCARAHRPAPGARGHSGRKKRMSLFSALSVSASGMAAPEGARRAAGGKPGQCRNHPHARGRPLPPQRRYLYHGRDGSAVRVHFRWPRSPPEGVEVAGVVVDTRGPPSAATSRVTRTPARTGMWPSRASTPPKTWWT